MNRKSANSLEQGWTKYFKNQKGLEMTLPKWESVLWSYKHTCQIIFEKPKKITDYLYQSKHRIFVFALLHFVIVLLLIISTNELDLTVYISIMNSKSDECCFRSGQIILKTYK